MLLFFRFLYPYLLTHYSLALRGIVDENVSLDCLLLCSSFFCCVSLERPSWPLTLCSVRDEDCWFYMTDNIWLNVVILFFFLRHSHFYGLFFSFTLQPVGAFVCLICCYWYFKSRSETGENSIFQPVAFCQKVLSVFWSKIIVGQMRQLLSKNSCGLGR